MEKIEWDPSFSVGVKLLDSQHKQIIDNSSREPVVVFSPELQAEIDAAFARDKLRKANELGQVRGTG